MGCIYRRKMKLSSGTIVETGPYWIKYCRNGRPICESTERKLMARPRRFWIRKRETSPERQRPGGSSSTNSWRTLRTTIGRMGEPRSETSRAAGHCCSRLPELPYVALAIPCWN